MAQALGLPMLVAKAERISSDADALSKHPPGTASNYAGLMMAGIADGYQLGIADACAWLRERGNHGAAAELEKALRV